MPNALFGGNTFSPYTNLFSSPYRGNSTSPVYAPMSPTYTQQPIMQNVQSMVPQSNMIWIDDISQIAYFPTGKGWQQWFGLKNEQVLYVRETDMNGVIQPMRKVMYQVEELSPNNVSQQEPMVKQGENETNDSVTREEFNKLSEAVNTMTDKLSDLLK